jgi:hypothetical protein
VVIDGYIIDAFIIYYILMADTTKNLELWNKVENTNMAYTKEVTL